MVIDYFNTVALLFYGILFLALSCYFYLTCKELYRQHKKKYPDNKPNSLWFRYYIDDSLAQQMREFYDKEIKKHG